jgi:hypothetical protein
MKPMQVMKIANVELSQKIPCCTWGQHSRQPQNLLRPYVAAQDVQIQQTLPARNQVVTQAQDRFTFPMPAFPVFDVQFLIQQLGHPQAVRKVAQEHQTRVIAQGHIPKTDVELARFPNYTLLAHLLSASEKVKWLSRNSHFYRISEAFSS